MPVFISLLKMAAVRLVVGLILIAVSTYHMYGSELFNSPVNGYSLGTLACKIYNTINMDCSHRSLQDIPALDQNWTTILDLSHNRLKEIHGEPFRKLSNLTHLDLSRNVIRKVNSISFRGLHSLLKLNLSYNKLSTLPSDVFSGLMNLVSLDVINPIVLISSQTFASLYSLQYLSVEYIGSTLDTTLSDFDRLTKLAVFHIYFYTNVTNTTFLPLTGLPIKTLEMFSVHGNADVIDKTAFIPFTSARNIHTDFRALSALTYLSSPLQTLILESIFTSFPYILHNRTFLVLSKFRKSLTRLALYLPLRQIENDSFM